MNLAVIILNWKQAAATVSCVQAVAAWQRLAPAIWVVDNASPEGSGDLLRCPAAAVLASAVNLGFAGGNNLALRSILASKTETVLLLNNDAQIAEDQVQELLSELAAHPRLGIVGPLLREVVGREQIFSAGGRDIARHLSTRDKHPWTELPALVATHRLLEVDYVPGTVALIRAEVFRRVGFFDEDYFFSGELADFCRRARAQGFQSAICSRAWATHLTARGDRTRLTLYRYYTLRNRFLYIRKYYAPQGRALFASFWSIAGLAMAARLLVQGRFAEARAALLALRDGLSGRFGNRNELFGA